MNLIKIISLLLLVKLLALKAEGQQITVLEQGTANDSSYYDIFKINNDEFWIGGKYGILKKVDSSGNISLLDYPNSGDHLLNINAFDKDNIIVTGDKGLILQYNRKTDKWSKTYLKGYDRSSFYKVLTVNDTTAFIAGGSSIVSFGGKAVPAGFILKTTDKGNNWKKIYGNLFNMVWDIIYEPATNKIYASTFNPLKGNIISTSISSNKWSKLNIGKDLLIHGLGFDEQLILAGTSRKSINKKGSIVDLPAEKELEFEQAGAVWSINNSKKVKLFTASNGYLIYHIKKGDHQLIKAPVSQNLYESSNLNDNSFYVVGSKRTLLRIDFNTHLEIVNK